MFDATIDDSPTLDAVQQQFESWRSGKTKRERIPEALWEAAVGLCRSHPITQVCRRLRLCSADLKKRLPDSKSKPVQFMELDLSSLAGPWHIECERPDGARLRVSGNGQPPAIEPLLLRFLS